ncbi:MAG: hypothetical protein ACLR8Y_18330 [Alistipes indistinctus]
MAGVSRRLEKQGVTSYYDLFTPSGNALRYVFRVLSFKLLVEATRSLWIRIGTEDCTNRCPNTRGDGRFPTIDWTAFARGHGTENYKLMRELNPWIRD